MTLARKYAVTGIGLVLILSLAVIASYPDAGYGKEYVGEEKVLPAHYPKSFDGLGRIDRIGRDEIVVDDSMHTLASQVSYATPTSQYGSRNDFRVGDYVGFVTDSDGQITSMWLITQGRR